MREGDQVAEGASTECWVVISSDFAVQSSMGVDPWWSSPYYHAEESVFLGPETVVRERAPGADMMMKSNLVKKRMAARGETSRGRYREPLRVMTMMMAFFSSKE
jgi:hypothetical protein